MLSLSIVAARIALLPAVLLLGACSLLGSGSPTATASPSPTTAGGDNGTVAQDLTFTGKLPARWTGAAVSCGQADGKGSDSFSVKLTALDGLGQMDTLTIVVGAGYKGAGDYSVDTTTSLATSPGSNQIAASTPQLVTNFIVTVDKTTGTIDSTMGQGANPLDAIERVAGTWRCK